MVRTARNLTLWPAGTAIQQKKRSGWLGCWSSSRRSGFAARLMKDGILILMPTNKLTPEIIQSCNRRLRIAKKTQYRHPNSRTRAMWTGTPRDRATPEALQRTQDFCRRPSPDGSRTEGKMGSGKGRSQSRRQPHRNRQTETQAECRWPRPNIVAALRKGWRRRRRRRNRSQSPQRRRRARGRRLIRDQRLQRKLRRSRIRR